MSLAVETKLARLRDVSLDFVQRACPWLTPRETSVSVSWTCPGGSVGSVGRVPGVKLNARNITTLPAIGDVRADYRDELLPGFFLRVTPTGHADCRHRRHDA